jgi:uncharacterized protein YegL
MGNFDNVVTRECLNIIFLLDTSGSMYGERINQLNHAMLDALNELNMVSLQAEADAYVRIIEFNSSVKWIMGDAQHGLKVEDAANAWKNLSANGGTDTAGAIEKSLDALHVKYLGERNRKPVVVLVTDGYSNDATAMKNATDKLKKALSGSTGKEKVYRIGIGVLDYNEEELNYFASRGNIVTDEGEKNDVPLVFKVDKISDLAQILNSVTVSSFHSITQAGAGIGAGTGNGANLAIDDAPMVIDMQTNATENWED